MMFLPDPAEIVRRCATIIKRTALVIADVWDRFLVALVELIAWCDRASGTAARRLALYTHPGFDDLRWMAADPNDEVEHYSTTAEGMAACKADCMFHRYPE